jgi:hypothetical protein
LLDTRDRIWAETKLIEWAKRREQDSNSSHILYICHFVMQRLTRELKTVEKESPEIRRTLCHLRDRRFSTYSADHPARKIQPFLYTHRPAFPDYSLFDYDFEIFSDESIGDEST